MPPLLVNAFSSSNSLIVPSPSVSIAENSAWAIGLASVALLAVAVALLVVSVELLAAAVVVAAVEAASDPEDWDSKYDRSAFSI